MSLRLLQTQEIKGSKGKETRRDSRSYQKGFQEMKRVLMFDIVRVAAILMIVVMHVAGYLNIGWLTGTYGFLGNISSITSLGGNLGNIGVELLIILSGCVLEYTYGNRIVSYASFIKRRLIHIYPIYWMSLIAAISFTPALLSLGFVEIAKTASGFWIFQTLGTNSVIQQPIIPMGFFVGLIICLYLMYPFLSRYLKENGVKGILVVFVIAAVVRFILLLNAPHGDAFYWFPLSRVGEFAFGIFIVQQGWYFKDTHSSKLLSWASEVSFPVFLVHFVALPILLTRGIVFYIAVVLLISSFFLLLNDIVGHSLGER